MSAAIRTRKEVNAMLNGAGVPVEAKGRPLSTPERVGLLLTALRQMTRLAYKRKHDMQAITAIYERYKHLDRPLTDPELLDGLVGQFVRDVWAAVKQVSEANAAEVHSDSPPKPKDESVPQPEEQST